MSFTSVETFGGFYISASLAIVVAFPLWSMKDIGDFETPKMSLFLNIFFFSYTHGLKLDDGFLYAASAGLLPVFALPYVNDDYSAASRTVAWLASGELMLPLLIGWFADKYDKRKLPILLTSIDSVLFLIPVFSSTGDEILLLFLLVALRWVFMCWG